jgi:hypothetical protein
MTERFTKDENGLPLEQQAEDGDFVVTSPAEPGRSHRWMGLDARR